MKRFLAILLVLIMSIALVASMVSCEEKTEDKTTNDAASENDDNSQSEDVSEETEVDVTKYYPKSILPVVMTPEFFEENIVKAAEENGISSTKLAQLKSFFDETKLETPVEGRTELSEEAQARNKAKLEKWPMLQKTLDDGTVENVTLYTLDEKVGPNHKAQLEEILKTYCPNLTIEVVGNHYMELGYIPEAE